ncbi:MAG: hypothetical protein IPN69_04960 [Acidobacteria bacterium]|nr:hypothetical protein [Acidobacteriota bacterium]MBK8810065.1 hypothetical protein [Acidobacteriota bacterium]
MKRKTIQLMIATVAVTFIVTSVSAFQAPIRVRFAKGKSSTTLSGTVGRYGKKEYILRGMKGQELWANVSSVCESVTLDVIDNGTGQSLTDPVTEYRDELPGTDDYVIRVQNDDLPSCRFTLKVGID